jgi:hypothetical protein
METYKRKCEGWMGKWNSGYFECTNLWPLAEVRLRAAWHISKYAANILFVRLSSKLCVHGESNVQRVVEGRLEKFGSK